MFPIVPQGIEGTSNMRAKFIGAALGAVAFIGVTPAHASTIYTGSLSGGAEVPAVATAGTGSAIATINSALSSLTLSVVFFGLSSGTQAATINCCALAGSNAATAIKLAGFPAHVKAGSYTHTFNLLANATYTPGFRLANGGTALLARNALISGFVADKAYLNITTGWRPLGEIRGQLTSIDPVPEPMEWALLLLGSMASGVMLRRQSRGRRQVKFVLA